MNLSRSVITCATFDSNSHTFQFKLLWSVVWYQHLMKDCNLKREMPLVIFDIFVRTVCAFARVVAFMKVLNGITLLFPPPCHVFCNLLFFCLHFHKTIFPKVIHTYENKDILKM